MFTKDIATNINTNNAEPRWIENGENAVETITNRPTYDVNIKHSFVDFNTFEYRRKENLQKMTASGFLSEILVKDFIDFNTKNAIVIKNDFTFNYDGIECFVGAGDTINLSIPIKLEDDIAIDMLTRKDNLDASHTKGQFLILKSNEISSHSGKLYRINNDVQIGDLLDNITFQPLNGSPADIEEVQEETHQDLIMISVQHVNITKGDGIVYLNGDKHTTPIIYADMTDQERVDFFNSKNSIRVKQDEIIQTQYEFIVETRFSTGVDFIVDKGYIEHNTDKGLVTKDSMEFIPFFQIERRNRALYDINVNIKGSMKSESGEWYQRSGDEVPLDAWGRWTGTVTGFVNTNQVIGYYQNSDLVGSADYIADRDITDLRMFSPKIEDTNNFLEKKISENTIRGYGYYQDCTVLDVTVSAFDPISEGMDEYLGAPSYSLNISGALSLYDLPGKLQGKQRAYITDDNSINFEIYSIVNMGAFNRIYTLPTITNDVPNFKNSPKIYNFVVQMDSIRPANDIMFVNEVIGDKTLYPTGTHFSKECTVTLNPDNTAYIITNNSNYDVLIHNTEESSLEFLNNFKSFRGSDTIDNATNLVDGTYRINDYTVIVPGGSFLVYVAATTESRKQIHNWYKDSLSIEMNDINRKFNEPQKIEGRKQFIYLNKIYVDGLKVIKTKNLGFTWIEVEDLVVQTDKNGFVIDTEIGYIYNIMYNGRIDYKQGYTNIEDRRLASFSDVVMTNSTNYDNMFMSSLGKFPQVANPNTEHLNLKVKRDMNSLNYVKHYEVDSNDFDYRSPIIKSIASVYSSDEKIYASVDFEEQPSTMIDKEIPNPGQQGNWFGYTIVRAKDVKRKVISAPNADLATGHGLGRGVVYVYDFNEITKEWDLFQSIPNPQNDGDYQKFGTSIAISDDGLLITIGQGASFTPNYSSVLTWEFDDIEGEYTQWPENLKRETKSQLTDEYLFGNADESIANWGGIGHSVSFINSTTLAIGIPGYNGDDSGTILTDIGRVIILTRSANQWNEAPDGLNLFDAIDGTILNKSFGTQVIYNKGLLYVGSIDSEVKVIDLVDKSDVTKNSMVLVDDDVLSTDTITEYANFTISESGEYFIYVKGRDMSIKQFQPEYDKFTVFKEYNRNEDKVPTEMILSSGVYINENDIITTGYYFEEPTIVNSFTASGGESMVIYYQPNRLDVDLYDYYNIYNTSSDFKFIRETDKLEISEDINQKMLIRKGSIQIDLRYHS